MQSINPATGEVVREYPESGPGEAVAVIERAHAAHEAWRAVGMERRAEALIEAARVLRGREAEWAELMTREMGKPIRESRSEVEKCAWVCEYYAEHGGEFLADEPAETDAAKSFVAYRPLGVILAVMPWNFPFWQVFRFAAPALMAGNAAVLKHAPNVPGCALAIREVFEEAGFPTDLLTPVLIHHEHVGEMIEHPLVRGVTLTGSTDAGRAVASKAGGALKPTVLELGGSDPCIILEDADLGQAVEACTTARLLNSGQSCIAAKRFIVVEGVREVFEARIQEAFSRRVMGDPMDDRTQVGPIARRDLRQRLHGQVERSVAGGARLLMGGEIPPEPGCFYPVTLLTDVERGTPAWSEELFGPVGVIIPVRDEEEALDAANDTPYGLGAAVFTADAEKGERLAREHLRAGSCFVNAFVRSDPRLPFGGIKDSGWGRELGREGIREWTNVKTVYVG
ncbi:MAG: NAD-dependent succinate-semialdehyde dehydrogenase [bacterium]